MNNATHALYAGYVLGGNRSEWSREVNTAREDLLADMLVNPDYQPSAKRNGQPQPMVFTRGGEQHTYNIVCRPGDQLYAGDMIDVFGEKWLVMEARADDTTHKTGIMKQCNYHLYYQNFTSEILEVWGVLDASGYSSAFNSDTQMQKSEDQMACYFPYDENTAKIFVDKRLASHIGYDASGDKILFTLKVTGTTPVPESFNRGDHLLMLKLVRDVYAKDRDRLDLMICDYIEPDVKIEDDETMLNCDIQGRDTIRIGTSRTYRSVFYDSDGNVVDNNVIPVWLAQGDYAESVNDGDSLKIAIPNNVDAIGSTVILSLSDADGIYETCTKEVEVVGIG